MRSFIFSILFVLFFSSCVWAEEHVNYEAPSLLGHTKRVMKTAGFWISRHPSPDTVIMAPPAIEAFNETLRGEKKLIKDIFTIVQDLKTETLLADMEKTLVDIKQKDYFTLNGLKVETDFLDDIRRNMNLPGIVMGSAPRYGLVVHFAPQRFLPTNEGLYVDKDNYAFDQLQNSALDTGTPVAVVHQSADGLWYYVLTAISDGWVEAKNIAVGDINQVKAFANDRDFAVVLRPKADIFLNEPMTDYYDYVRMGTHLPLAGIDAGRVTVNVPVKGANGALVIQQAYMNVEDTNTGFLPLTARNIYKQALMMLNQPYGWGDMYGEQDCSRFVQMVFATFGIVLPRDSKDQARVGRKVFNFDETSADTIKIEAIMKSSAANTLLAMKGHIMIYLGTVDGKPYAIHDTTGYKQMVDKKEVKYAIDRVVISDLSLGQGASQRSLLRRIIRTVTVE
ncbi:MAG: SH3 domain-containing protein [Candidatus Omnitrophica bacterium]|nr:SH3 domain-containing protein [Candidatus Omnitrophota bacterium]